MIEFRLGHQLAVVAFCLSFSVIANGASAQSDLLRVEMVEVKEESVLTDFQLSGTIEAKDSIELGFKQSGRVIEVLADEGDYVARGDALARLEAVQQDQALQVAQAAVTAAQAAADQARQASDRAKALLARGVGTRAARDNAVQAESEANGALESAQSNLDQAQRAVDDTVLRAPEQVVITDRYVAPGQIVGAAQPAFSMATLDGMEAVFAAADHPRLDSALGSHVKLTTLDIQRPPMSGTVSEISPLVDPASGTVTLRVAIDGVRSDMALLGAAVRAQVEIAADQGIAVPWTALMRQGEDAAVWIVNPDNSVSLTPVKIGSFVDGIVFLTEGVEPGQTVVGAGSQLLYPGRQVQRAEVLP